MESPFWVVLTFIVAPELRLDVSATRIGRSPAELVKVIATWFLLVELEVHMESTTGVVCDFIVTVTVPTTSPIASSVDLRVEAVAL